MMIMCMWQCKRIAKTLRLPHKHEYIYIIYIWSSSCTRMGAALWGSTLGSWWSVPKRAKMSIWPCLSHKTPTHGCLNHWLWGHPTARPGLLTHCTRIHGSGTGPPGWWMLSGRWPALWTKPCWSWDPSSELENQHRFLEAYPKQSCRSHPGAKGTRPTTGLWLPGG